MIFLISTILSTFAQGNGLDLLAGSWGGADSYITQNQCISAPNAISKSCSPASQRGGGSTKLQFEGFVSATNSTLDLSDDVKSEKVKASDVQSFFEKYNYSEFLAFGRLKLLSPKNGLTVGVNPYRYQGQLKLHNPNLPLVSLVVRQDLEFFSGYAHEISFSKFSLSAGAMGTLVRRQESLVESTILDIAARPISDIVKKRRLKGSFFDLGFRGTFEETYSIAVLSEDLGGFWDGFKDDSNKYLFINYDRTPRTTYSLGFHPAALGGRIHLSVGTVQFHQRKNTLGPQWLSSLSYIIGPTRITSGFSKDIFRTGIGMDFSGYDVAVVQEWKNSVEAGRKSKPKFTLSVAASL